MHYVVDLDPTHQALRITISGTMTHAEGLEMYAAVSHIAARGGGGPYSSMMDATSVTGSEVTIENVHEVAKMEPMVPGRRHRVLVASRPSDYGLFFLFTMLRNGMGGILHLVISSDEAYKILKVRPEDFTECLLSA